MPPKTTNRTPLPRTVKKNQVPANSGSDSNPRALSLEPPPNLPGTTPSVPNSNPAIQPSSQETSDISIINSLKQIQENIDIKNAQLEKLLASFDSRLQNVEQTPTQATVTTKLDHIEQETYNVSNKITDLQQSTSDLRTEVTDEVDDIHEDMTEITKK